MQFISAAHCVHCSSPSLNRDDGQKMQNTFSFRQPPNFDALELISRLLDHQKLMEEDPERALDFADIKAKKNYQEDSTPKLTHIFNNYFSVKPDTSMEDWEPPRVSKCPSYSFRINEELEGELEAEKQRKLFSKFIPFQSCLESNPYQLFRDLERIQPPSWNIREDGPAQEEAWNFILSQIDILVSKLLENVPYLREDIYLPALNFIAWIILVKCCTDENLYNKDFLDSLEEVFANHKSSLTIHELYLMELFFLKEVKYNIISLKDYNGNNIKLKVNSRNKN